MEKLNGLHVNKSIRSNCISEPSLYTENGKVMFKSILSARYASYNINKEKGIIISPSELYLMSLIEAMLLTLARKYVASHKTYFSNIINIINSKYPLKSILAEYLKVFPTNSIFEKLESIQECERNQQVFLESTLEMFQLRASENNPAYKDNKIIFENSLKDFDDYTKFVEISEKQLKSSPKDSLLQVNLYDLFEIAYKNHPTSLVEQIQFLLGRFSDLLQDYEPLVLNAIDSYNEEFKPIFFGSGESEVPSYEDDIYLTGAEAYTMDTSWMPGVVLIAKNVLVWLDQLSKKYERDISTLNSIPDEELEILSNSGINGLWLIGLWDRSEASKIIKQWSGNPEAESSAYSLRSYTISEKLGGREAFLDLKQRAKSYGIRLCADMVPNHTSIDSPMIHEHPDWFIQLDHCPFPSYSFSGESLSQSDKYGVFLEDHYFDHTDASVVFKYEDYETHKVRYIYHGNDGTNMPWNDTAQLDYIKSEVREAVLNKILEVAKDFPIIRFDAAMTLTKKHFHRLWYPEPGSGGDIPTRSSYGFSKAVFDKFFPKEFWREVVDRINAEAPDTLLLAEAFWLLEGYFVRTLGMHRVYNSAFMNMLRDEDNQKYRDAIKLTLEFDREILKRYVNFMSNPDEKTAIEQFGDGDKYFGICLFMSTLPGLPMFAHGQIEGYKEKYGMEYSKAYWEETPNEYITERHKREVFPVLKKRYIFSDIINFRLYDFNTQGGVDENVFALTNGYKKEKGLFIYNNAYRETEGYIKTSVNYKDKFSQSLLKDNIAETLDLLNSSKCYLIYKDQTTGLEYIHRACDVFEKGLHFKLRAYEYHLLLNFRVVIDDEWGHYGKLWDYLKDQGVADIKETFENVALGPLHAELKKIINKDNFKMMWDLYKSGEKDDLKIYYFFQKVSHSLKTAKDYTGGYENSSDITDEIYNDFNFILKTKWYKHINSDIITEKGAFYALVMWMFLRHFGEMKYGIDDPVLSAELIKEWKLKDYILDILSDDDYICTKEGVLEIITHIIATQNWLDPLFHRDKTISQALLDFAMLDSTMKVIKVNRFDDILWFNKECALMLIEFMRISSYVKNATDEEFKGKVLIRRMTERVAKGMFNACEKSEYKYDELLKLLG
ncbi:MAG: alpha-amylase [Abditibacteriota bacterium]|nr:alpha-amylase [Abditibacteriota bacterium]